MFRRGERYRGWNRSSPVVWSFWVWIQWVRSFWVRVKDVEGRRGKSVEHKLKTFYKKFNQRKITGYGNRSRS